MDKDLPLAGKPADRTDYPEEASPRPAVNESPGVIYTASALSTEVPDRGSRAGGVHMVDDPDQVGRASHLSRPAGAPVQDVGVLAMESSVWEALEDAPAEARQGGDTADGALNAKPAGQG